MDFQLTPIIGAILGGTAGLLGFSWIALKTKPEPELEPDPGGVCGTAEVAENPAQIKEAGLTSEKAGGFFISAVNDHGRRALLRWQGDTGGLVFSPMGGGKTTGFLMPTLFDAIDAPEPGESFIVLDPAAQNLMVCGPALRDAGYEVSYALAGPCELEEELRAQFGPPLQINTLGGIDIRARGAQKQIGQLAAVKVPVRAGGGSDNASFFSGSAQGLTKQVATWLRELHGPHATWPMVAAALHASDFERNQMYAAMKENSRFESVRLMGARWHVPMINGKPARVETNAERDVVSTACRELEFLLEGSTTEMFSGPAGDVFGRLKQRRGAVFLIASDSPDDGVRKTVYSILHLAKGQICKPGGLWVNMLLDDACAVLPQESGSELIAEMSALLRKYRGRLGLFAQSVGQFHTWCGSGADGQKKARAIRANMGVVSYFGANDPDTIDECMKECGQRTVWQPGTNPEHEWGIEGNSIPIGVPLFQQEALRGFLREGWQVVLMKGSKRVLLLPRVSYRDIPEFKARAAPDPHHES